MEIKLKLKVRDVEIELTRTEAIELKKLLNELTGKEIIREKEYAPWWPYSWPYHYVSWETSTTPIENTCKFGNDCQISYTLT